MAIFQVPSTRIKQAIFRKNGKEALGNCHPHLDKRVFEQGSETCDLTSRNSGMSWFCAKPTGFQCEDVTSMKHGYVSVENIPITKAEKDLFRYFSLRINPSN